MEPWGLFFYFGTTHIGLIHLAALAAQCSCLMGGPHLRITWHGYGVAMCSRAVLVHCPRRLGAAVTILAAKLLRGDGVFTKWALEGGKAAHHFDGV